MHLKQSKNIPNVLMKSLNKIKLKPVLITLTLKNGSDLSERSAHLIKSLRKLIKRRQDYNKKVVDLMNFVKSTVQCIPMKILITN